MINTAKFTRSNTYSKGWLICALGALFYCYEYLLRIEPSIMVPELMHYFDLSANKFGIFISLYYLAYTPMQFFVGIILDIYKPRYILSLAAFICAVGSLLFCASDQLIVAAFGRFLMGIGSAFAFVGALKLATEYLPKNAFALFSGLITSFGMLGAFAGNVAISYMMNAIGWQTTLYLVTIIGFVFLPFLWQLLQGDEPLITNRKTFSHYQKFFSELKTILKNKTLWKLGATGALFFVAISVFAELWGITYLKNVYHLEAHQAAFANSLIFLGWFCGAPINGYLSDLFERRNVHLLLGGLATTFIISVLIFHPFKTLYNLEVTLFLLGLTTSTQALCFVIARENNPSTYAGTVLAFINVMVMLGGLMLQPLLGLLLHTTAHSSHHYQLAFGLLPVCYLIGTVLAYSMNQDSIKKSKDKYNNLLSKARAVVG